MVGKSRLVLSSSSPSCLLLSPRLDLLHSMLSVAETELDANDTLITALRVLQTKLDQELEEKDTRCGELYKVPHPPHPITTTYHSPSLPPDVPSLLSPHCGAACGRGRRTLASRASWRR